MRTRSTYSRFLQNVMPWSDFPKGKMIQALHHCIEHDLSSFLTSDDQGNTGVGKRFGIALSESGLSRDEIQLITKYPVDPGKDFVTTVDDLLIELDTDYLDLLLLKKEQLTEPIKNNVEQLISQGKLVEIGGWNIPENSLHSFGLPLTVNRLPSPLQLDQISQPWKNLEKHPEEPIYIVRMNTSDLPESLPHLLMELAPTYNCSPTQLYFTWLLQHSAYLHLEIDYTEPEDLAAAIAVKEKRLDPIDWQKINLVLTPEGTK